MALNQNAAYALRYLQDKYKLKDYQAAGVVGNLYGESGLNTGAINRGDGSDGSNSIGIAQWNGQRSKNLRAFGGGNYNNLDTQLDFVMHEMAGSGDHGGGSESAAYKRLMAATDLPSATQAFIGYERPRGWSVDNPTAGHNYKGRLGYAGQLLGMSPDEIAAATPQPSATLLNEPKTETSQPVETAKADDDKPLFNLPKLLPDTVLGVNTKKGLKLLDGLSDLLEKQTDKMNQSTQAAQQAGASRRANGGQAVELALMNSQAQQPQAIAGAGMPQLPPDLLKALMMLQGGRGMRG